MNGDADIPADPLFGAGDSSGSSGPTLLDYLNTAGTTATGVLGALQRQQRPPVAPKTNWAIIGGIAAAFLGVLLLVLVVSGRGK
jgi:hypothetical protein